MNFEQAGELKKFIEIESGAEALSDLEIIALEAAWRNITYDKISKEREVNENTLKGYVAPLLWKKLSQVFNRKITKKSFRAFYEEAVSSEGQSKPKAALPNLVEVQDRTKALSHEPKTPAVELSGAALPLPENFYGREEELLQLQKLLQSYSCLLILGAEGIGKKSLIARLICAKELPFSKVIWKPVHHRPSAMVLEAELLELLGKSEDTSIIATLKKEKQLLIVLESLDALMADDGPRKLGDEHASLIRRITEETNASVIAISVEPIQQLKLQALRGKTAIFMLHGLKLPEARDLVGGDLGGNLGKVWEAVGGNPLMLKQIAAWADYTQGLDPRVANRATIYRGMFEELYEQTFRDERLSTLDRKLLINVAASGHEQGVSFSALLNSHPNSAPNIQRLIEMGLLQKTAAQLEGQGPVLRIYEFFRQYLVGKQASSIV